MKILVLISLLFFCSIELNAQQEDSSAKVNRNIVEIGLTSISFYDGYGMNRGKRIFSENSGSAFIGYTHLLGKDKHNFFIGANHFYFSKHYAMDKIANTNAGDMFNLQPGDLFIRQFYNTSIFMGKRVKFYALKKHGIYTGVSLSLDYRYSTYKSGEEVFLGQIPGYEPRFDGLKYDSYGWGIGAELSYIFNDKFLAKVNLTHSEYNEDNKLVVSHPDSQLYQNYKANQKMLILQYGIGYLF